MKWLVSDQGAHFANSLLKTLTAPLHVEHHFTTAYCQWANGSIEILCKEVLRACSALRHELKLNAKEWPAISESVQSILNNSPFKRLGLRKNKEAGVYRTP